MIKVLVAALLFASMAPALDLVLNEGDLCGRPCGTCAAPTKGCKQGLMCVYNPTGCARGYMGTCKPTCSVQGRNRSECAAVGDHCKWYFRSEPNCLPGDAGCRLEIEKYIYNGQQTCGSLPCKPACDRFPQQCSWDVTTSKCKSLNDITKMPTPKCWTRCTNFRKGDPQETCPECDDSLEYEYETNANSYCWNYFDDMKVDRFCREKYTTTARCNADPKCAWTFKKPTRGGCISDGGCHVKDYCRFKCKNSCLRFDDRCNWVVGKGCRRDALTRAPTTSSG